MIKYIAAGLAALVLFLAGIALGSDNRVLAGDPNCTDTIDGVLGFGVDEPDGLIDSADPQCQPTATATATVAATATSTPLAATATSTPAGAPTVAAGTATATPRLPAAAPQTGGDPGSGSETLILTLLISAVAIMSAGGVVAGYALGRRYS